MKRNYLLVLCMLAFMSGYAQVGPQRLTRTGDPAVMKPAGRIGDVIPGQSAPNPTVQADLSLEDPVLGSTVYDLQTNAANQNRLYLFPDGTLGGTWTLAHDQGFSDRGTGYNYFDGTAWGPQPSVRVESVKTGWPSYAPYGPAGEIIACHRFPTFPMYLNTRMVKGTGSWTETTLGIPSGADGIDWPRMVTNGQDHMNIHVIALTPPTASGGSVYQGMDGALVYNRSLDGGVTWDGWEILPGMTSAEYLGISGDAYAWAEPRGDTLCFVVGENWFDQFIMKSTDNGETWTKTIIWPCPYNLWNGGTATDTIFCPDGASAVALDKNGKAHVLFGLQRALGDESGAKYWFPYTDGLIYWNEDKPELPQELDPEWLEENGYVIGWVQDTMVWYSDPTQLAYYYVSMSSMPQIAVDDDQGLVYAVWSSVTMLTDPDNYMLRHLFARTSLDGGTTWEEEITDITGDFLYSWTECVFPSMSPTSDNFWHLIFQGDDYAGALVQTPAQGQTSSTENSMIYLKSYKWPVGTEEIPGAGKEILTVSGSFPNPASDRTTLRISLNVPSDVKIELRSVLGQQMEVLNLGHLAAGYHPVPISVSGLATGVYQYIVTAGNERAGGKLVIK